MGLFLRPQSLLIGVNVLVSLSLLNFMFISPGILRSRTYTYIGDDYPVEIPLPKDKPGPFVAMALDETVHYELNMSNPNIRDEWDNHMRYPRGAGRVHLGSNHKVFTPVFWHQLHCIRELGRGINDRNHPISTPHHIKHCINYLRQTILCDADHSLEAGDFTERDFEIEREGGMKVCRPWDVVEGVLQRRMLEFFAWFHRND